MGVPGEVLIKFHFCLKGAFFIESVNVVDLVNGTLVAGTHTHLLALCYFLPLSLLLIELLQLLPQLIRRLLLHFPLPLLILLIFSIGCLKMLFINFSLFRMFSFDILLIFGNFLSRS